MAHSEAVKEPNWPTMLAQGVGWAVPARHMQLWWAQPYDFVTASRRVDAGGPKSLDGTMIRRNLLVLPAARG